MKRIMALIAAAVLCLPMAGCLKAVQADDYIYVVGIGFDKGAAYRYNVSFLVQKDTTGDRQAAKGGGEVLAAEGDTIFDTITVLGAGDPLRIDFSRVNTLFFSEELARMGSISELAVTAFNYIKLRKSMKLVVCLGEAMDFLQGLCTANTPNITKLQLSVFQNYAVEGITDITNYSLLMEAIRGGRSDITMMLGAVDPSAMNCQKQGKDEDSGSGAPPKERRSEREKEDESLTFTTAGVRRTGGMSSYIMGVALFDGWYMKGVLSGNDTKFLLMVTGRFQHGNITVPYLGTTSTLYLKGDRRPKIKLELGASPKAEVDIILGCNILQFLGDARNQEWELGLKKTAEKYVEAELKRVFLLCRDMNSDAMGFGKYASMQFHNIVDWEAYNWKELYKGMDADFNVTINLLDENMTTILE